MTHATQITARLTGLAVLLLLLMLSAACAPMGPSEQTDEATAEVTPEVTFPLSEPVTETMSLPDDTPVTVPPDADTTAPSPETDEPETTAAETSAEEITTAPIVPERVPDGTLPFIPDRPETIDTDWKAMWISQFDLYPLYLHNGMQRDLDDFRSRMAALLDNVAGDGFNTVVLQLRPYGDSMYPSDVYPPSRYCVGSYGAEFTYDPITVIMELCQGRGLAVHGWINPMRAMTAAELEQVDDRYLIKQWYNDPAKRGDYLVTVGGRWYLNPAHEEVRHLICDGAAEILDRYAMAGIHMDDYFYPTPHASFDALSYGAYLAEGGECSLDDWRRENLDKLVSELYATVKSHDLRALFGISPAGVIDTVYNSHYADVYKWCAEPGYVDYICPQLYFGFEHATCAFDKVCETWQSIVQSDYVSLIIGLGFGKAAAGVDEWAGTSGKDEWTRHKDILLRSLKHTETIEGCVGVTVFSYQHLFDPLSGDVLEASRREHELFTPYFKEMTWRKDAPVLP